MSDNATSQSAASWLSDVRIQDIGDEYPNLSAAVAGIVAEAARYSVRLDASDVACHLASLTAERMADTMQRMTNAARQSSIDQEAILTEIVNADEDIAFLNPGQS